MHTALLVVGLAGCVGVDEPDYGVAESALSVGSYQTGTCSTSVVIGLSKQVAEEIGCANPTDLVKFSPSANLQITSSAVLPFLHAGAKTDLEKVAETRVVQVNSAFRTVVQQYLLFQVEKIVGGQGACTNATRCAAILRCVHVAEAHARELPDAVREAATSDADPNKRIIAMLGAAKAAKRLTFSRVT